MAEKFMDQMTSNLAFEMNAQPLHQPLPNEQPEQSPEHGTQKKRKQQSNVQPKVRPQDRYALSAVASFAAIALMAILVLTSYIDLNSVYAEIHRQENQLSALQTERAQLESDYNELFDSVTLSKAAAEAGLRTPTASQKVYLEMEEEDNAQILTSGEKLGPVEQFMADLRELGREILSYFAG